MSVAAGADHDGMPGPAMDPTFYRSAAEAVAAPTEKLAYASRSTAQVSSPTP